MLKQDEIKYIEDQIKKTFSSISHQHYQFIMNQEVGYEEEYKGWTNIWLENRITDLYYLILTYLEAKQMVNLLNTFQFKFAKNISEKINLLKEDSRDPEDQPELQILGDFKQFLEGFKFFDYNQVTEDESKKLYSILKNTGFIIEKTKCKVKNEADIYKQVKWVLDLYYPTCRLRNRASFIQEFKSYNPDILIPELKTAIEYKYVNDISDNIDEFIDQLKIDSSNYTDDYRYDKFIAVIYLKDSSFATPEKIEISWISKKFPNNWDLIISSNSRVI